MAKPVAPFDLPTDLTGLTPDELSDAEGRAVEAFDEIREREPSDLTGDDLTRLEELASGIEAIRAEQSGREAAVSERAEKIAALGDRVHTTPGDLEAPADPEAPAEPAEPEAEVTAEPVAAAAEEIAEPEAVVAAAPSIGQVARTRPRVPAAKQRARFTAGKASLVASSAVPGYTPGQDMTLDDVAAAAISAAATFPRGSRGPRSQVGICRIELPVEEGLVAGAGQQNVLDILDRAADESRLRDGSLVAAGGWCAPSETLYDLVDDGSSASAGILSVPEIGVTRGGIRFTPGPDICAVFASTGFTITEAQDIAETEKTCFHVPCADFEEVRLDAVGICVTAGILANKAYPELVRKWIDLALVGHAHRVNAKTIAAIVTGSTADTLPATGVGASAELLDAVELATLDVRYRHRMPETATVELVLPVWAKGIIRSDLAKRAGLDSAFNVTDAMIRDWFAIRGAAVQFVYDWQDASCAVEDVPGTSEGFGSTSPIDSYPTTLQFLAYPAGTFVRGGGSIITLDAVYDSALLIGNDFTAIFSEEGHLVAKRGHTSRVYTVASCATGSTGTAATVDCTGTF